MFQSGKEIMPSGARLMVDNGARTSLLRYRISYSIVQWVFDRWGCSVIIACHVCESRHKRNWSAWGAVNLTRLVKNNERIA